MSSRHLKTDMAENEKIQRQWKGSRDPSPHPAGVTVEDLGGFFARSWEQLAKRVPRPKPDGATYETSRGRRRRAEIGTKRVT